MSEGLDPDEIMDRSTLPLIASAVTLAAHACRGLIIGMALFGSWSCPLAVATGLIMACWNSLASCLAALHVYVSVLCSH